jgi:hypothetical protein
LVLSQGFVILFFLFFFSRGFAALFLSNSLSLCACCSDIEGEVVTSR